MWLILSDEVRKEIFRPNITNDDLQNNWKTAPCPYLSPNTPTLWNI